MGKVEAMKGFEDLDKNLTALGDQQDQEQWVSGTCCWIECTQQDFTS